MKRYFLLLFLLVSFCSATYAQLPNANAPAVGKAANIGQLLTQVVSGIKPDAFTSSWGTDKANWMQQVQSVASDAKGIAGSVTSLAGYIKPDLFKEGTTAQSIANIAQSVTSLPDAAGLLKTFEGGLKPEAFTSDWQGQRNNWQNALNMLQR